MRFEDSDFAQRDQRDGQLRDQCDKRGRDASARPQSCDAPQVFNRSTFT
jgi:hypothetical protein